MAQESEVQSAATQGSVALLESEDANTSSENITDETPATRTARLVLEDFIVTSLLKHGKSLTPVELATGAEDVKLSRARLREGLETSTRAVFDEPKWELTLRGEYLSRPRSERGKKPLESTIEELLLHIGKPLPLPVIVRELSTMRGVLVESLRDATATILASSRLFLEVAPSMWHHTSFLLDAGAPRPELVIRENKLENDADWQELKDRDFSLSGSLAERATAILNQAGRPLSYRVLGALLWQADTAGFDSVQLAKALGDRTVFASQVGGFVTTQSQLPALRTELNTWLANFDNSAPAAVDVPALLRHRLPAGELIAPRPEYIEELKQIAMDSEGGPIDLGDALRDVVQLDVEDVRFAGTLQGLNDALRSNAEWMPAGIGRFLLREAVPEYVGLVPDGLRPVHLSLTDAENEPIDVELTDEGLEGDCVNFVHAPEWEDVNEEIEARAPRYDTPPMSTRYVVLYHHNMDGTVKLRKMDEEFFAIEAPLARIAVKAHDGEETEELAAWYSRESGLLYGLGEWFIPRAPMSGGVLEFSRQKDGIHLQMGEPDAKTNILEGRIEQLEDLQERADFTSLFDLLKAIMSGHRDGMELPTLWAQVNVVRRTTKRQLCSVLCAYHCFSFKQRGPEQLFWRFDASKAEAGFKRPKRKFVQK